MGNYVLLHLLMDMAETKGVFDIHHHYRVRFCD